MLKNLSRNGMKKLGAISGAEYYGMFLDTFTNRHRMSE